MKKVLHLTLYLDIGGLERMIWILCRGQKAAGLDPRVLVYERGTGDLLPQFQSAQIPVTFHPKGEGFSLRLPFFLHRYARANGIGLIHSHDLGALIYASLASLLSFGKIRVVHTQHSFQHLRTRKMRIYERVFPWLAWRLVCVSEDLRRTYLDLGQTLPRLRIVPNGVDFAATTLTDGEKLTQRKALLEKHGLPESLAEKTWVITLGRLAGVKGPQHAVEIWRSARTDQAVLFCVGPETEIGMLARLRGRAAENVFFPGPTLDPHSWLAVADLFLSASEFEGLPLAGLEAAAARLPMLLSEIPGHSLFRGWAAYFPLRAYAQAGNVLEKFLESRSLGENTLATAARDRLERACGAKRMTERYLKIYEEPDA